MTARNRILHGLSVLALSLFAMSGSHAVGSTSEAWKEFGHTVETACRAAAAKQMTVGAVRIDPFGTADYGLAVLTAAGDGGADHVCIYDKAKGTAEIGGPLQLVGDPALPFSPDDQAQLSALRDQVRATLADIAAKRLPSNGQAATVKAMLDGRVKTDDIASALPGPYRCTVYWYGFLDEGARRVGAHRCVVSAGGNGALYITKNTGEGFYAETVPWVDGLTAFAGRSYLPGHGQTRYDPDQPENSENGNFGNKVGLVLRSGERLFLVSIDERGMSPKDPTFFEITELVPQL